MVWACCWRSVDTRTYNATRIGCSLWLSRRRHRPAQDKLVRPIPPVLPVWLLAGLPPDMPGAPHGRPPAAAVSVGRATPADRPAAAKGAATSPAAAGRSGSSRTCHLRSNHRTHHPVRQANPRLDHPAGAPPRAGGAVDLAGGRRLHPAAPGPRARRRSAAGVGAAPPARAVVALPGPQGVFAPAVRVGVAGRRAETLGALPRPAQGPALRPRYPPPGAQEAHQETQEEATHHHQGRLTGPTRLHARRPRLMGAQQATGLKRKLNL